MEIGIREAKNKLSKLVGAVHNGEEVFMQPPDSCASS